FSRFPGRARARPGRLSGRGKDATACAIMSINKFPPKKRPPRPDPDDGPVFLYGLHTVRAALDNPGRDKTRLLATPNALNRLRETGPIPDRLPVVDTTPRALDELLGKDAVHQGAALEVDPVDRARLD